MLSPLDPASISFLNGMNAIQTRSSRAQRELTTGLRITSIADDPTQIPLLLETRSQLSRVQQINSNLSLVKAEVDTGESSLSSAVSLVERAQTLATQGQSSFATPDSRLALANELGSLLQQLGNVANTAVGGRYIFGGDSDQTAPYSIDLTQPNPVSPYAGTPSTRQVESPDGTLFPVARTAQDIFDNSDPTLNVFQAVNNARVALLNGDQPGIDVAISALKSSGTYLNEQLSFYGTAQDRMASAQSFGSSLVTQLKARLSGIEDADMTQAITEFTQASNQQQAALTSRAKLPTSSLFNYLG